jgi:hypothetical protein
MMPFPLYTWDRRAQRYRSASGTFVSARTVRQALDDALRSIRREMRATAQSMRRGEISVGQWRVAMEEAIKDVHLFSAALAKGGWGQMTQADYGRVGRVVRRQYGYLEDFALEVADGAIPLDGRVLNRVEMYFEAGRGTFHKTQDREVGDDEFDEERSIRHASDSCDDCLAEEGKGWQPRGEMIPIGERQCLSRCKCTKEYRNSVTGKVFATDD